MDDGGKPLAVATKEDTPLGIASEPQSNVVPATQVKESRCRRCLKNHWRYIQYCMESHIFKLPAKYTVPMSLIGETSHGISWLNSYNSYPVSTFGVSTAFDKEANEYVSITKANPFESIADAKGLLGQIRRLRHMNHKNIFGIKNIIAPYRTRRESFEEIYTVHEQINSDLDKVMNSETKVAEEYCQSMLYQILCGLKYMHSANILHKAIKPECLMLNTNLDLKICCLEMAGVMMKYDYMAPELLLKPPVHTTASDVWAAGLVFLELVTHTKWHANPTNRLQQLSLILELVGTPPEDELEFMTEFGKRVIDGRSFFTRIPFTKRFPHFDSSGMDLAQKMLAFDPGRRITVDEALAHPYLKVLHEKNEELVCMTQFNSDFEQQTLTMEQIKGMICQEAISCNT